MAVITYFQPIGLIKRVAAQLADNGLIALVFIRINGSPHFPPNKSSVSVPVVWLGIKDDDITESQLKGMGELCTFQCKS